MSWFSAIFKRKRGGTLGGRIIRQAFNELTGGLAGATGLVNEGDNINKHLPE